jgi:hypothetical protein
MKWKKKLAAVRSEAANSNFASVSHIFVRAIQNSIGDGLPLSGRLKMWEKFLEICVQAKPSVKEEEILNSIPLHQRETVLRWLGD